MSELLIALLILGVIATFTIPKVLQSQQDGRYKAIGKEAAGTIAQAFEMHKLNGGLTANTRAADLTPYINYVKAVTTGEIDDEYRSGTIGCTTPRPCLILHNGAAILSYNSFFNGTSTPNFIAFLIDPDGKVTDGTTNGPGKSIEFDVYYNGRLTSKINRLPGSENSSGVVGPCGNCDPPWFSWN